MWLVVLQKFMGKDLNPFQTDTLDFLHIGNVAVFFLVISICRKMCWLF